MIETIIPMTSGEDDVFENLITKESLVINHVVVPPGKIFPTHMTEAEVYIIVTSGKLTIKLNNQPDHTYSQYNMVSIPKGIMSGISNLGDVITEVYVVKHI